MHIKMLLRAKQFSDLLSHSTLLPESVTTFTHMYDNEYWATHKNLSTS